MRQILIGLAAIFAALPAAADTALPDWMSGAWCGQDGDAHSEEVWLPPAGELMVGMSRTVTLGRRTQFEFLRVALINGVPAYIAQPGEVPPTVFKRTDGGRDWMRFENPEHDFPKRIEYRRSGDRLHAEIAGPGKDGKEKVIPFEFRKCGL